MEYTIKEAIFVTTVSQKQVILNSLKFRSWYGKPSEALQFTKYNYEFIDKASSVVMRVHTGEK